MLQPELYEHEFLGFDPLIGYLTYIIKHRAIEGVRLGYWETLYSVLKTGGCPCGWIGDYPEGRLVVYYEG